MKKRYYKFGTLTIHHIESDSSISSNSTVPKRESSDGELVGIHENSYPQHWSAGHGSSILNRLEKLKKGSDEKLDTNKFVSEQATYRVWADTFQDGQLRDGDINYPADPPRIRDGSYD